MLNPFIRIEAFDYKETFKTFDGETGSCFFKAFETEIHMEFAFRLERIQPCRNIERLKQLEHYLTCIPKCAIGP